MLTSTIGRQTECYTFQSQIFHIKHQKSIADFSSTTAADNTNTTITTTTTIVKNTTAASHKKETKDKNIETNNRQCELRRRRSCL